MRRICAFVTIFLLCALAVRRAEAHDVRGEHVFLDIGERAVAVELRVPLTQLAVARQQPVTSALPADARASFPELSDWVQERVRMTSPAGRVFSCAVDALDVSRDGEGDALVVNLRCSAPSGETARKFEFRDDIVLGSVVTDDVYVFLRRDGRTNPLGASPELLGHLHWQNRTLLVDRTDGSRWGGLRAAFAMGLGHVASGADHMLFLAMLLLAAPWVARGGRWAERKAWRAQWRAVLVIATAFTIGHSATLALGALGLIAPPVRWIEVLVATSVVIAAVHVLRPMFAGREAIAAGALGLVHGLAFATALAGLGFDRSTLVLTLVGFNLGVEAAQLLVILVMLPILALAARARTFSRARIVLASATLVVAVGWVVGRTFDVELSLRPPELVALAVGVSAVSIVGWRWARPSAA